MRSSRGKAETCLDEGVRADDRPIDVRLSGEMDDRVDGLVLEQGPDELLLPNAAVHEAKRRVIGQRGQALAVAGVGQGVQDHHAVLAVMA